MDNFSSSSTYDTQIRKWLKTENIQKLEQLLLQGQGELLLGLYSTHPKVRRFLKTVPAYMTKLDMLHESVSKGNLRNLQLLLKKESGKESQFKDIKLVTSKDRFGVGLLHKAVHYGYKDIVQWLIQFYPSTLHVRDKLHRIPLHYASSSASNCEEIWKLLVDAGSDTTTVDVNGRPPSYYMRSKAEIHLPNSSSIRQYGEEDNGAPIIKPSTIRIWIHNSDLVQLQRVLWEGEGERLKLETSNKPIMKKFLNAVPFIMKTIQDVHNAVIKNDLYALKQMTEYPVPADILTSKDANGVTPLHKAAGFGHEDIVKYIIEKCPKTLYLTDNEERTPLHFVALFNKNRSVYNIFLKFGANDHLIDKEGRTPKYLMTKPEETDRTLLVNLPSCPRICNSHSWDWNILNATSSDASLHDIQMEKHVPSDSSNSTPLNSDSDNTDYLTNTDDKEELNGNNSEPEISFPELDEYIPDNTIAEGKLGSVTNFLRSLDGEEKHSSTEEEKHRLDEEEKHRLDVKEEDRLDEEEKHRLDVKENEEKIDKTAKSLIKDKLDQETNRALKNDIKFEMDETNVNHSTEMPSMSSNSKSNIDEIILNGNIDELADLILDGRGSELLNKKSKNPHTQIFIDNVPLYMRKIELIHYCCQAGNLTELKRVLDRRKFIHAVETKTNLRLTPLHVATLFGHASIVEYIASHVPESVNLTDTKGRTPLHFSCMIPNNLSIYNLLLKYGADKNLKDNKNRDAIFYLKHPESREHSEILEEYVRSLFSSRFSSPKIKLQPFEISDNKNEEIRKEKEEENLIISSADSSKYESSEIDENETEYNSANVLKNYSSHENGIQERNKEDILEDAFENNTENERNLLTEHLVQNRLDEILNIEVPVVTPPELMPTYFTPIARDRYGRSALHFAACRMSNGNILLQLLHELDANIAHRDDMYRTPRDVAILSKLYHNQVAIDRYVFELSARDEADKLFELMIEGYDHILDIENKVNIIELASQRNNNRTVSVLNEIPEYQRKRDELLKAIRLGNVDKVKSILNRNSDDARILSIMKNENGRCSMHVAVLAENEEVVRYICKEFPETLYTGDNLERKPLHYAMGVPSVEVLSKILITAGAQRSVRDLLGNQPSYYFLLNADILRLQIDENESSYQN